MVMKTINKIAKSLIMKLLEALKIFDYTRIIAVENVAFSYFYSERWDNR